jgi:ketol-acid reductoisomerase
MALKIRTTKQAPIAPLKGRRLAVIGFGSQGHAQALNLRDNGFDVVIGLHPGSKSRPVARRFGFKVMSTAAAVKSADVILVATPDTAIPDIYRNDIAPHLRQGKTLVFAHGFAVHFKTIPTPKEVDVVLVAPKGPGHLLRSRFLVGKGLAALVAVHQDVSGRARKTALAWASGIGCARSGILETTFREETITDLFGEQCVICGGAAALVKAGFDTLVQAGYPAELAYFECLHELKLTADLMHEHGIAGMRYLISDTAEWGDLTAGPKIIDASVRKRMKQQLKEIESGRFAKTWCAEAAKGGKHLAALRRKEAKHPIERVGTRLRNTLQVGKSPGRTKGSAKAVVKTNLI